MTEEITMTTNESNEPEDLRIPSYAEHGWMKLPQELKTHFDTKRFGVFDVVPPMFSWEHNEEMLQLVFKWGVDISNHEIPLNKNGVAEFCWIPTLRSQKYIHPPREFNKFVRQNYPRLCLQQQPIYEWADNGDVITLILSWDLTTYVKPEETPKDQIPK